MLDDFLANGILVKEPEPVSLEFFGEGRVMDRLRELERTSKCAASCFAPRVHPGLQRALGAKRSSGELRAGTVFAHGNLQRQQRFHPAGDRRQRNRSSLPDTAAARDRGGVGNLYLSEELSMEGQVALGANRVEEAVSSWVASDLHGLIARGMLDSHTARIYRGCFVRREDVSFDEQIWPLRTAQTVEDKVYALEKMFVGTGKVIARYSELIAGEDEALIYCVNADMARARVLYRVENEELNVWGTGQTRSVAKSRAFMEGLERYSISSYSMEDFLLSPRKELTGGVLEYSAFLGDGELDTCGKDLPTAKPRRWHPVKNFFSGKEYLAPLELVRYPVPDNSAGYYPPSQVTSSGVAAHLSYDAALKSACHELVERDAFLIAWLRKTTPPLVNLASLPSRLRKEVERMEGYGWQVRIIDLTADLAPVVSVLLSRESEFCRHSIGAASNDDLEEACLKAFEEAQINFSFFNAKPRPAADVLDTLCSPKDHMELYAGGEFDDLLLEFFGGGTSRDYGDIRSFSGTIMERIRDRGLDLFVADLGNKRIKSLAPEIFVLRAIVPGLVPIHFGKHWARTGSPRIKVIPELAGWRPKAFAESDYQRFAHPFP